MRGGTTFLILLLLFPHLHGLLLLGQLLLRQHNVDGRSGGGPHRLSLVFLFSVDVAFQIPALFSVDNERGGCGGQGRGRAKADDVIVGAVGAAYSGLYSKYSNTDSIQGLEFSFAARI